MRKSTYRLTFVVLTLAIALTASLCACTLEPSKKGGDNKTETVTDMIGREVTVTPGTYKKVVCIGAGALRMYSYVGDVNILSGVEDIENLTLSERPKMFDQAARPYVLAYKDVFSTLPSCGVGGPMAQAAEAEKILSCEPDIVVSEYEDVEKENALQTQLGVPVITLRCGQEGAFGQAVLDSLKLLGKVFGREERAETVCNYITEQKTLIFEATAAVEENDRKTVYIGGLGNWGTTNHLMTAQNYSPFEVAHVNNAVNGLVKDGIQAIEKEKFVEVGEKADIMILDSAAIKNIKPLYQQDNAMFDGFKACENGEVYLEMAYNAYYTNIEIALANTWWLAKVAYPELFTDLDMTEKTDEITRVFFGKDLASEIFACPASFDGYRKIDVNTFFA